MKNIIKTILVTAASVSLLSGCIKETFPLEGAATSEQLAQSAAGMAASVDGLVAQMYQPYYFFGSSNQLEFDISYAGLLITYARMTNDIVICRSIRLCDEQEQFQKRRTFHDTLQDHQVGERHHRSSCLT